METKNPLNAAKKEEIKRKKSLNKNAPKQLRESVVGELVDEHEKILLSDTMNALSYEDLGLQHAKGRDFAGPFVVYNAMRDVFAHLLHYTLGPLGLFVLVPWLGKEYASAKLFLYQRPTRNIYIGSLAMSFTGPMLILYVVVFVFIQDAHQVCGLS